MYYIENWSLTLDLIIVVGTVEQVLVRLIGSRLRRRRARHAEESALPAPSPAQARVSASMSTEL
jgi:hypothetical protein